MTADELLARIVTESDEALARWARWSGEIFRGLPLWATTISNAAIEIRVVLDVPDGVECPGAMTLTHETGEVERKIVHKRFAVTAYDADGWVERSTLGAGTDTDAGRGVIAALSHLRRRGLVEKLSRLYWRPTADGRREAKQ